MAVVASRWPSLGGCVGPKVGVGWRWWAAFAPAAVATGVQAFMLSPRGHVLLSPQRSEKNVWCTRLLPRRPAPHQTRSRHWRVRSADRRSFHSASAKLSNGRWHTVSSRPSIVGGLVSLLTARWNRRRLRKYYNSQLPSFFFQQHIARPAWKPTPTLLMATFEGAIIFSMKIVRVLLRYA